MNESECVDYCPTFAVVDKPDEWRIIVRVPVEREPDADSAPAERP